MDTSRPATIDPVTSRKALPERKRHHRSPELKRQIVEETLAPGASVARVARAHGVNANQVFGWRRQYHQGLLEAGKGGMPGVAGGTHDPSTGTGQRDSRTSNPLGDGSDRASQRKAASHRRGGYRNPARGPERVAGMIGLAAGTRIWIVAGVTDMRRGFVGLSGMVQTALEENPFSGQVFVFRGRRGDLIKMLWWDGDGLCLFAKRLEPGRFIWWQASLLLVQILVFVFDGVFRIVRSDAFTMDGSYLDLEPLDERLPLPLLPATLSAFPVSSPPAYLQLMGRGCKSGWW